MGPLWRRLKKKNRTNGESGSSGLPCGFQFKGSGVGNWTGHNRTGTSLIGKEHPSCSQTTENLEGQTEKVDSLGLRFPKKNCCGSARKRARKARLAESSMGPLTADILASGSQQQSLRSTRASVALGVSLCGTKNPGRWGASLWIAEATEVAWGHSERWAF